jgi:hypothetical protein
VIVRRALGLFLLLSFFVLALVTTRADHLPVQRPDGAIIHGDWGLYRPGHVTPWVEGPYVIDASRYGPGYYFPTNRNDPSAYRSRAREFGPSVPAEPYFRSWGTQSEPSPNPTVYAPFDPPSVIYAPKEDRRGKQSRQKHHKPANQAQP